MQKIRDHVQLNHLVDHLLTIRKVSKQNTDKKKFKRALMTFLARAVTTSGQLSSELDDCMATGFPSQCHKSVEAWLCVPTAAEAR